ncbi:MAG: hypothetical protein CM15mP120_12270 [Pseudomonadota bacterium]|nr:MAG: hypothetical protein CM15mP120_12270 [Pseudomonadota bacterium]
MAARSSAGHEHGGALPDAGSEEMIPTPCTTPFLEFADNVQRQDVRVPLVLDQGRWSMDLQHMQRQVDHVKW